MSKGKALRALLKEKRFITSMVFCEFPSADLEYPRRFAQEMQRTHPGFPLYFNYSANLKWHEHTPATFDMLADMGYKAMHVSQACLRPSLLAVWDFAADLKARGTQAEIDLERKVLKHPLGTINDFAGFPRFREMEARYLPGEDVERRYRGAAGS
jgi:isocitrate lyase